MSPTSSLDPRILILAFSVHPDKNMEDRNGWHRALQAAKQFRVVVLCSPSSQVSELYASLPESLHGRIDFIPVKLGWFSDFCLQREILFYRGYRNWLWNATRIALKLHAEDPFRVTHLVSLCGFREPGYLWKLGCPSIVGPIGGTSGFRCSYLRIVDCVGGIFEIVRNAINGYQTRFSLRIRKALQKSTMVIAANSSTRDDLQHYTPKPIAVTLETGIDFPILPPKPLRPLDQPLQILWAGRLRAWKALPLLLHAIALLPDHVVVNLRVLGDGKSDECWKRLAKSLKIHAKIHWVPKPSYRESLHFYREADLFAFTSLRDTSGTGILEALTSGTPVIGLNHQGCADIITTQCGIPISVRSPKKSIMEIRDAIVSLSQDSARLKQLSDGALLRAKEFQWSSYETPMLSIYRQLIESSTSESCT